MSLRLIYGKAGSGKTNYCFNEIKKRINENEKIYIITPEQFSFTEEKNLLNAVEQNSVVNAEVLTFGRMAFRIMQDVGGVTKISLSDASTSILLYDVLDREKDKLVFLGKNNKNIDIVKRIFTELKKHKIKNEQLQDAIKNTENYVLKKKLEDILLLKKSFELNIPTEYIEGEDTLGMLEKGLEISHIFDDSILYLDEFAGFTKQEYDIIEKLLVRVKEINVTVCIDKLEDNYDMQADLFYANKQTALKLIDIAKKNGVDIKKSINLNELYRFKNNELLHLEENIYRRTENKYNKDVANIKLFLAQNPYSEIENVAKQIINLVREENYRYKDISIIAKNLDDYKALTKVIFNKYEIPVFIDQKKDLSDNILVQFIISIFDIFAKNWSYETVFTYLKTGLTEVNETELYKLENYCLQWGIKGKKWYIDDWTYGNLDKDGLEEINSLRIKVIEPLLKLKNSILNNKNVKDITSNLYYFLDENEIFLKMHNKASELNYKGQIEIAKDYENSIKIILDTFDEIVNMFGTRKISFEKYREILKIALENKTLGAIPGSLDEVIIGDIDRSRSHKVKAVFILGINDGIFPSIKKNEGFLDDGDREILKQQNIELAKGSLEQLYDERFNIYKALSIAEEKLFLSYTSTDKEGKAIRPSVLINNIKRMYPQLKETSDIVKKEDRVTIENPTFDDLLEKLYIQKQGECISNLWYAVYYYYKNSKEWNEKLYNALKGIEYTNVPEKIEKEQIEKLYGNTLKTSVSRLEQYRSCPFSFHLKYGLKLKEPISLEIRPVDSGSFMHEVIDSFFEKINRGNIKIEEITKEELEKIVSEIIDKKLKVSSYYKLTSNARFITLTRKLKKIILKSMEYIVLQLVNSNFKVLGSEIEFKNGGDYPPIVIQLDNKEKVEITGKIDRVDLSLGENGRYVRIVDYKSSVKKIDLNEVVYGLQIQLLTYLNEMSTQLDAKASGILYFNLVDYLISSKKRLSDEELEQELIKNYKMQGIIIDDIKVIKAMDTKLENGYSNILPVFLDKNGNVSAKLSSTISKDDFENLQKQVINTIKEISKEILQGDISLKPYYKKNKKTPCTYCPYHSICNFNTRNKDNSYYFIPQFSKEEILNNLKNK